MHITRKVVQLEGVNTALAFIDMQGLDINTTTETFPEDLLVFNIKTYNKLDYKENMVHWKVFNIVNEFLDTLSQDDLIELGRLYGRIGYILKHEFKDIAMIADITNRINSMVWETFSKTQLSSKLEQFVSDSNIPFPDLKDIGNRPQDNPETTFYYHEYVKLTTIVIICKMFFPIFGEIISITKKALDNTLKETHCITILKDVLANDFGPLTYKLQQYIYNAIARTSNGSPKHTLTAAFNGYTVDRFTLYIYASTLVKKFVNVDLFKPDGNIMTYVMSCVRGTIESITSNMSKSNSVMERENPQEFSSSGEGNMSRMETESYSTKSTVDIPVITKIGTELMINRFITELNIDKKVFNAAIAYHKSHPIPVTCINKYVLATMFGHRIGGAYGINLLNANIYTKLVILTQLYAISINNLDIVHTLSIAPTDSIKTKYSIVDSRIKMDKGAGFAYRNCKAMFPYAIGNITWDSKAKEILDYIITKIHVYNTAPVIWEMLNQEEKNSEIFTYQENVVTCIIEFINYVLNQVGQKNREEEICITI